MTKVCQKCGKEYSESHKFCNDCGGKLKEKKENQKLHHSKSHNKLWGILAIFIVILIISAIIIFAIPFAYSATEAYTEKEPYESTEYYSDTEQYTDKECDSISLTKNIKWGTTQDSCLDTECNSYRSICVETNWLGNCLEYQDVCQSTSCTRYKVYCNVVVKNLDNKGGTFSFDGYYITKDEKEHYVEKLSKYLQPDDENSFVWVYNVDTDNWGNCKYKNFITPKKTECENVIKSKTVQKSRPITKYKNVEKTRSVTKYATLFQQWTGKVKWYYKV